MTVDSTPASRPSGHASARSLSAGVYGQGTQSGRYPWPMSAVPDDPARSTPDVPAPRRTLHRQGDRQDRPAEAVDQERPRVRGAGRSRRARPARRAPRDAGRVRRLLPRRERHLLPQRRHRRRGRPPPSHQAPPTDRRRRPRRAHGPDHRRRPHRPGVRGHRADQRLQAHRRGRGLRRSSPSRTPSG